MQLKLFAPQLRAIAKRHGFKLNTSHGYLAAYRILIGKASILN